MEYLTVGFLMKLMSVKPLGPLRSTDPTPSSTMAAVSTQMIPPPAHSAVVVRSITVLDSKERENILQEVEYNIFAFPAGLVTCDYLSDSGTSAMTDVQWAGCKHTSNFSVSRGTGGRGNLCFLFACHMLAHRGSWCRKITSSLSIPY